MENGGQGNGVTESVFLLHAVISSTVIQLSYRQSHQHNFFYSFTEVLNTTFSVTFSHNTSIILNDLRDQDLNKLCLVLTY
jgi:hypothetical protein